MTRATYFVLAGLAIGMAAGPAIGAAESKPSRAAAKQSKKAEAVKTSGQPSKATDEKKTATAVFAGGCFWCTEHAFEQLKGVVDVESGYAGGTKATANYEAVHLGTTGHAEVIRVTYDPEKITYQDLLDVFFNSHDPTQLNRQGADEGTQYRSAIFYANEEEEKLAKAKIADLEAKKVFKRKIVTKLEKLKEFYAAEDYHQDFARRNPFQPYIQSHAIPKAYHVREKRPDLIRQQD